MPEQYTDLSYLDKTGDGSNVYMKEMIHAFISDTPPILENMNNALSQKKWNNLKSISHTLKSVICFMGIHSIKEVMKDVERYSEEQTHLDLLPALIVKIQDTCIKAMDELKMKYKL